MSSLRITVCNPLGLHARPAAKVVDCASRYASDIQIQHHDQTVDAKSIMSVLMLAAPCGAELEITAVGADQIEALNALKALFDSGFGELE